MKTKIRLEALTWAPYRTGLYPKMMMTLRWIRPSDILEVFKRWYTKKQIRNLLFRKSPMMARIKREMA